MKIIFDPDKNYSNILKHGISLAEASRFEWATANIKPDLRKLYPEMRFQATGLIGDRVYVVIYCERDSMTRIISLRKANSREVKAYVFDN